MEPVSRIANITLPSRSNAITREGNANCILHQAFRSFQETFDAAIRKNGEGGLHSLGAGRAATTGAALAYYTLFSIPPLLVIALAAASLVFGQEGATGQMAGELKEIFGDDIAAAMQSMVQRPASRGRAAGNGHRGRGAAPGAPASLANYRLLSIRFGRSSPNRAGDSWGSSRTGFSRLRSCSAPASCC